MFMLRLKWTPHFQTKPYEVFSQTYFWCCVFFVRVFTGLNQAKHVFQTERQCFVQEQRRWGPCSWSGPGCVVVLFRLQQMDPDLPYLTCFLQMIEISTHWLVWKGLGGQVVQQMRAKDRTFETVRNLYGFCHIWWHVYSTFCIWGVPCPAVVCCCDDWEIDFNVIMYVIFVWLFSNLVSNCKSVAIHIYIIYKGLTSLYNKSWLYCIFIHIHVYVYIYSYNIYKYIYIELTSYKP